MRKQCGQADRPSARGKIDIISIDSDYDNDHDSDLLCPPLAVIVFVVIVIDILTNTEGERRSPVALRVEVFHASWCRQGMEVMTSSNHLLHLEAAQSVQGSTDLLLPGPG
ncbi:MAG: hypothetical protein ACLFMR_10055, partial [Desulfohalobiaceae bacterium]